MGPPMFLFVLGFFVVVFVFFGFLIEDQVHLRCFLIEDLVPT